MIGGVLEAVLWGFKYARFDLLSGFLAGLAAVLVNGISTLLIGGFDVDKAVRQLLGTVIQLVVTVVAVVPLSYFISLLVRSALRLR